MAHIIYDFIGGDEGEWKVLNITPVKGETLPHAAYIKRVQSSLEQTGKGVWSLKGIVSNLRYTEHKEKEQLVSVQADLGRSDAICAALIPMRKSEAWWALAQDERRRIFEQQSHHTQTGLRFLPAIARKLYHSRDIGEPFDFITWFEYAPKDAEAFDELLAALRSTEEWTYVDREVDIRLMRV